jgi:hypothetical protein
MKEFMDIVAGWLLIVSLYYFCTPVSDPEPVESLYLDPDSAEFALDEKNYMSIEELRDDLLALPIYYDWVAHRSRPRALFMRDTKHLCVSQVQIMVIAAARAVTCFKITAAIDGAWGGDPWT